MVRIVECKCKKRRHKHVMVEMCMTCRGKRTSERKREACLKTVAIAHAAYMAKHKHVLQDRQAMENPLRRGLDPQPHEYRTEMASLPEWDTPPDDYTPPKS